MRRIDGPRKIRVLKGCRSCEHCVLVPRRTKQRPRYQYLVAICKAKNRQPVPAGGLRVPHWCPFDVVPVVERDGIPVEEERRAR
jgi:hypothetical protein